LFKHDRLSAKIKLALHKALIRSVMFNRFWGYVAVCVQLYCRRFTVSHLVVAVLYYMFRPTWSSSSFFFFF
jgi:hypothetical protein